MLALLSAVSMTLCVSVSRPDLLAFLTRTSELGLGRAV